MPNIVVFIAVGFLAQMIDGALGMAYGVSSNTFLLSLGAAAITPAVASASVHSAEVFTTLVSGLSHSRLGNIDRKLFATLVIPGVLGGVLGAYVLTRVPGDVIKPFVAAYLLVMGLMILWRAIRQTAEREMGRMLVPLGTVGGILDAIGGGGWGPIVTSTLVARGKSPRMAIGSVNAAEFFVTLAESVTFLLTIGSLLVRQWQVILGLLIGGVIAAPLAAYVCKRLPSRVLMILVGILIVALSTRTVFLALRP